MRRPLLAFALAASFSLFASAVGAQAVTPPDIMNRPIPGVGHDYIQMLSETVNPADGSVNLNIKLPTPAGRGISLPFSITYNSGAVSYLASYQPGLIQVYYPSAPSYGGWGNSLPSLSFSNSYIGYPYSSEPGSNSGTCYFSTGYTFHGLSGAAHSLGMAATSAPPSTYANCEDMGGNIPAFFPANNGEDSQVVAMFTEICGTSTPTGPAPLSCTYAQPPMEVFDAAGTIYSFLQTEVVSSTAYPILSWPATIEDRNGNVTHINAVNGIDGAPLAVTDSAGRTLVSLSYSGNSTVNPTAISAGGVTYNLAYASHSSNYFYTGEQLPPLGLSSIPSGLTCGYLGTVDGSPSLLSTITLPNSEKYKFSYDPTYGLLSEIVYPDGGWVKYTWEMSSTYTQNALFTGLYQNGALLNQGCNFLYKTPVVATRQVGFSNSTTPVLTQTFTYNTAWDSGGYSNVWSTKTTTVQTTDNVTGRTSQTIYTYSPVTIPPPSGFEGSGAIASQIPVEQKVQYYDWGNTTAPLRTIVKQWFDQFNLESQQTILDNNQTSQVTYQYGFGGAVTQKQEFDLGSGAPGTLLRTTVNNYQAFPENPLFPLTFQSMPSTLLTFPCQSIVYDGAVSGANRVAETDIQYDGGASVCGTAGTPSVSSVSGLPTGTHDETYYGPSSSTPAPRGNATTVTKQCLQSCTNAVTTYTYDETGQVLSMKDPCGNATCSDMTGTNRTTTYSYSDSYSSCGGAAPPSGNTNAYLTAVTNPIGQANKYCYGYTDGQLRTATDPNNQTTSYAYGDPLLRLTQTSYPDGGQTAIAYNDSVPSVTTSKKITSSLSLTDTTILDGMGHVIETELTSDPSGTDYTVTTYDGEGHAHTVTNPYRSTSDATYGVTTYTLDALGRTTNLAQPDTGSVVKTAYCGPTTLVTDEASKWRRSTTDGLGRLIEVDEPNSTSATVNSNGCPGTSDPVWKTVYTYDTLDDLASAVQGGSHNRRFVYDSLKRLTSSTNPETGSVPVTYAYDADSNVSAKSDGRAIPISYAYDVLSRLTGKTYTSSTGDHAITYAYDQPETGYYNVGRRTSMTDAGGSETLDYDPMGRELIEQRTTNSVTKNTAYTYNLDGSLKTLTYPGGRTVTYTYNGAAQPVSAVDVANSINYATSAYYAPNGALAQVQGGSNLVTTHIYNQRLQPCWTFATTGSPLPWQPTQVSCASTATPAGNIFDLKYNFNLDAGDNGDVISIANNRDTTRSQSFTYDQLNRLTAAQTSSTYATSPAHCWGESYTTDQWSNLSEIGVVSGYSGCAQESLSVGVTANNQLTAAGFSYDAVGNMLGDAKNAYAFNSESEIKTAAGVTYTYDGDGNRLEKSSGTIYWYGAGTEIINESNLSGSMTYAYVFFGGKRIAYHDASNNVYYYAEDNLGSTRTLVEAGQTTPCYDADFYPFGGERDVTLTCSQNYKFEGKERDTETGNDDFGARYYESSLGRWLSNDWSATPEPVPYANLTNPQTLNLYAMVRDNPETYADLDGHCPDWCDRIIEAGDGAAGVAEGSLEVIGGELAVGESFGAGNFLAAKGGLDVVGGLMEWHGAQTGDPSTRQTAANFNALITPTGFGTYLLTGNMEMAKDLSSLASAAGSLKALLTSPKDAKSLASIVKKIDALRGSKDTLDVRKNLKSLKKQLSDLQKKQHSPSGGNDSSGTPPPYRTPKECTDGAGGKCS